MATAPRITNFDTTTEDIALVLENERLRRELRAQLADLRSCRARLVSAIERERRRIERDLHDGTQGRLVSLAMSLGFLESMLPDCPVAAKPIAREARQAVAAVLEELRELSQGIYPSVLAERGLEAALSELCDRAPLPATLETSVAGRLATEVESAAYFVASEALANAAKHAHAQETSIRAWLRERVLVVEVSDDGIGGASLGAGSGLRGLADRVEGVGGALVVLSQPGAGTTVRAEIPFS
jgi:signal transduction histidine kinase